MLELRSLPATAPLRLTTGWTVSADPGDRGRADRWFDAERPDARAIPVPGVIQQVLPDQHGVFWYYLRFRLATEAFAGQVVQLRFGAVDYLAEVWLNGQRIGGHEGAETPFVLDATAALARSGDQLLAMRVVNPDLQVIDGLKLAEIACRNKSISTGYAPGAGYNYGGILLPVDLAVVPRLRVADLWVRADAESGRILATITVANDTDAAVSAALRLHAAPSAEGSTLAEADAVIAAAPGTSEHEIELTIPNVRRWNLEDPHLYRITATLDSSEHRHDASVRTGFRDFRIVDGFFHLNGTRIFLRSSHTGNHFPIGMIVPMDPDLMRRDLLMAKASGFNTVRFIAGMPYPEQLDYCDEIGLMVYEENLSAWLLGDSPQLGSRFDLALREMILRDRNHPCVTIWGLLNETPPNTTFLHAVASLPLLRSLDTLEVPARRARDRAARGGLRARVRVHVG
ncbi:MAG: glycoside hydrolase family 2, partial [Planctomycetes bacterium]|nr:glycoside hydrolase family 2 [Planctomycetota bacterium]